MLEPFFGEFLLSPTALELSFSYCSHKCAYCFANLNSPNRSYDGAKTHRLLDDLDSRISLAAYLLREKYPVCLSNKVDPFAHSNWRDSIPAIEKLTRLNVPIQFQTRGGMGIDEALAIVRPSVWYISMCFSSEDEQKRIEPAAPSIKSRFELMEKLTAAGHKVVMGLNPCVPEWMPDPRPTLIEAQKRGVTGVWIEHLHLSADQRKNLSRREIDALGPMLISRVGGYRVSDTDKLHFELTREIARDVGLEVYSVGQVERSEFFAPWREVYGRTFPTLQDWVNDCHDSGRQIAAFDEFAAFMLPSLPDETLPIGYYIGATSRKLVKELGIPRKMTYFQLLEIIWGTAKSKFSLVNSPAFAYVGHTEQDGGITQIIDHNDRPYIAFSDVGFDSYYTVLEVSP